jgi:hypothetical protein
MPRSCSDVTVGNNGGYKAGPGRDDVSGYGVVDVSKLVTLLQSGTQILAPGGDPAPADTTVTFTNNQISELADWAQAPHQSHKATVAAGAWKAANH